MSYVQVCVASDNIALGKVVGVALPPLWRGRVKRGNCLAGLAP